MATNDDAAAQGREEALQRRLEEMRSEREAELKRIRRSAEPAVQDNRRLLAQALNRQSQAADGQSSSSSSSSPAAQTPSARAVLVEVRGLFESRPVSRILQSSGFRTELESLVRSSLTPRAPPPVARPSASPARPSAPSSAPSSASQASTSALNFAELMRQRREEFVQEIGELLHSQLVTNTLDSGFRGRLETSVRRRVDALPDGGRGAIDQLGGLPPSRIVRNDFSHLGIVPPDQQSVSSGSEFLAVDDAVSVVSLAAAPATDPALGRQMQKEFSDLRRMMRLLMSAQLETQRMIRQEVSASLANQGSQEPPQAQTPARAGGCLVCLTAAADTVMYRCGHLCLCSSCSLDLRTRSERITCPVCRASVTDMMRVYVTSVSQDEN